MDAIYENVKKAAVKVAREWPGIIDTEDAEQEIWVKLLESQNYVQQVLDMQPGQRTEALRRIGHQVAARYRNDYDVFTGNVFYGVEDVRKLLEAGILTTSRSDIGNGSETLTSFLDAQQGMEELQSRNTRHAEAVWSAYVTEDYDRETSTKRDMLSRAVTHLADRMNQANRRRYAAYEDGPGKRTVITNSAAAVTKSHDYTGDFADGRR